MRMLPTCANALSACICALGFTLPLAAYALGFLDCKDISARCMLTIFQVGASCLPQPWLWGSQGYCGGSSM